MRTVTATEDAAARLDDHGRLHLLCEVGGLLATGWDAVANLSLIPRLAAAAFADWSAIDLVPADRTVARLATAGEPPAGERFEALQRLRAGDALARALKLLKPELVELRDGTTAAAYLVVPLVARSAAAGALSFARFAGTFSDDDRMVAVEIGRRAALALENAHLAREAQDVRQEAEALQDIGLTLAGELDAARILHEVVDASVDISGARFGAYLPVGAGDAVPAALIGITRDRFAAALTPRARDLFEPTLRTGVLLRLGDLGADPRFAGPISEGAVVVRSFLAIPVVSRAGELVGGMFFGHERPDAFTRRHEGIIGGVAAQAATALDNARLYEAERSARAAVERAIQSLELNDERLQLALRAGRMGIWHWDVAADRVTCSDQVERIFALPGPAPLSRDGFLGLVHEEDRAAVAAAFERALQLRGEFLAEFRVRAGGDIRWVAHKGQVFTDATGRPVRLSGVCMDVTARKQVEQALARQARQLAESNAELEQFAYIASHDLQEPLRMVTSYLALLKRRYGDKLDDKADEYMQFAVDGAHRMMALINDLLAYSRAGRVRERPAETAPSEEALTEAIGNLRTMIAETGATIAHRDLPVVRAQHLQLVQLFQNLVGNAIKFRGGGTPEIEIRAERREREWVVHVRDNGIGIAPAHHARIFEVFQRLHSRGQYAGTGIGLAICKKIVERLGGKIWVDSNEGAGATFSFSIPD